MRFYFHVRHPIHNGVPQPEIKIITIAEFQSGPFYVFHQIDQQIESHHQLVISSCSRLVFQNYRNVPIESNDQLFISTYFDDETKQFKFNGNVLNRVESTNELLCGKF